MHILHSVETQAYVLNFRGRVTQASVKNFQLVHSADGEKVIIALYLMSLCAYNIVVPIYNIYIYTVIITTIITTSLILFLAVKLYLR